MVLKWIDAGIALISIDLHGNSSAEPAQKPAQKYIYDRMIVALKVKNKPGRKDKRPDYKAGDAPSRVCVKSLTHTSSITD
jgi:hypothetical protein